MKGILKYPVLVISAILIVSTFSVASSFSSDAAGTEIVMVSLDGEDDLNSIRSAGGEILERYPNRALVELPEDEIDSTGLQVRSTLPRRTEISVSGYRFDINEGEPDLPEVTTIEGYEEGEKGQYIVHMLGPISSGWREEIEDNGVEVMNYIHNHAYRVRMTPETADDVEDLDFVDWIGVYHPEYKIQPDLEPGTVNIRLVEGTGRETIEEIVETVPVISSVELDRGFTIKAEVDSMETIHDLASITDVRYISEEVEYQLHDEMATQVIGGGLWFFDDEHDDPDTPYRLHGDYGSYMNQIGYSGEGVTIAIADTGLGDGTTPDAGHDDFTGRVVGGHTFGSGGWDDGHGHGTHCTGSAAGDTYGGTEATVYSDYYSGQGSAPESDIYAVQIFENGGSVIPSDLYEIFEVAAQESDTYVHSNSWGSTGGHGTYTEQSTVFDAAVRDSNRDTDHNEPMVITTAAGNDGDTGVPPPASAKNIIVVGGTEPYNPDAGHDNPEYMYAASSRGFVDDNRVKPDVVAPAESIYSTMPGNDYGYMSGTSMSNPAVAGAAAVVVDWYEENYGVEPSPAMVRSLMINTANQMDGDTEGPIPNGDEGWGMVDISKLERPHDDPVSFLLEDQESLLETGEVDEHTVGVEDQDEPLKMTLTWTDKEAPEDTGSGDALINDLNLEVISPSGDVYKGNAFENGWTQPNTDAMDVFDDSGDGWDDTNNVENVYIHPDELESGAYTINVEGFDIPEDANNDGDNNQDYALSVYNAAENPRIEIERPLGGEYWEVGEDEDILWDTEEGGGTITDVDLEYSVDGGTSWDHIEEGHADTGSYTWTVPDEPTDEAMIRATVHDDLGDTEPGVDTSGEFTITEVTPPEVTLTSPIGGEEWHAGEDEEITWDSQEGDGTIIDVDLEYTSDAGETWETIVEGIPDTGSYTWTVPDVTTSEAMVRIWVHCDEDTSGDDMSDDHFDLVGYPPEPPSNLDVEWWSLEQNIFFEDDVSEDKGYETWESHDEASEWAIRSHDAVVGDNSWDWGDGEFNKNEDYGMESRLTSPEIDVPAGAEDVELRFEHWRDFGDTSLWDGGNLRISEDGGDFEIIEPEEGYDGTIDDGFENPLGGEPGWGGTHDWETATFDLSEFTGSTIELRWNAGVEAWDGLYGEGWRIDDIVILEESPTGTDHNLVSWDSSPGDWPDARDSLDRDTSTPTSDAAIESTRSRDHSTSLASSFTPQQEEEWRWLYDADWRAEADDAIGLTGEGVWYGAIRMDLSDDVGEYFTEVAYHDHEEAANYVKAYVGEDDGGAPAEDWTPSEEYEPEGAGWVELELDDPLLVEDPGDYWIVMELDDLGDGYSPFGAIEPNVDDGGWVNMANPHDPGSWEDMDEAYDLDYTWALETRVTTFDVYFDVEIVSYDEQVDPGEEVLVDYTVTNLGEQEDTQDIEFYVDGGSEDTLSVNLEGGQEYDGEFTWQTDEEDMGRYDLLVSSDDSEEEVTVEVGDPKEVDHYNVYRSDDETGPWDEPIGQVDADGSDSYSYIDEDKGEADDIYWWYVVRAVSVEGVEDPNENAVQEPGADPGPLQPSDPEPEDGATGVTTDIELSVYVEHEEEENMDVHFHDASDDTEIGTDTDVAHGDRASAMWEDLEYNTEYEWYAVADDGDETATSEIWSFTTELEDDVDSIEISTDTDVIVEGEQADYTATAYDENGDEIGDVTAETTWSIEDGAGGEWDQQNGIYTSENTGTWTVTGEYEGLTDESTLIVEPSEVHGVVIDPEQDQVIEAGEELVFDAEAYDEDGDLIEDDPEEFDWQNADIGVFYETEAGDYDVTATYDGVESDPTTVTVEASGAEDFEISPEIAEITAGESQGYTATAYDEWGNDFDVTGETTWSDDIDDSNWVENEVTAYSAGEWSVTGEYDTFEDTASLDVEPAPVDTVTIYPEEDQTVAVGEELVFDAEAEDEYGNLITEDETEFTWQNADNGVFYEEVEGDYDVTATYDGETSPITVVTVVDSDVDEVVLDPEQDQTIEAGDILIFDASAYDEGGNLVTNSRTDFDWDTATRGVFNRRRAGEYEVTASYHGVTSEPTMITVESSDTARVEIAPEIETVDAGDVISYTATAYDAYENEIGDVSDAASWSIETGAGGSWTGSDYTSENAGTWIVEVEYEGETGTAFLTVEPGLVDTVELDPSEDQTIVSGEMLEFSAAAYDEHGNLITGYVDDFEWEETIRGIFYQTEPGEYEVTASYGGMSSEPTTVTVEEGDTDSPMDISELEKYGESLEITELSSSVIEIEYARAKETKNTLK